MACSTYAYMYVKGSPVLYCRGVHVTITASDKRKDLGQALASSPSGAIRFAYGLDQSQAVATIFSELRTAAGSRRRYHAHERLASCTAQTVIPSGVNAAALRFRELGASPAAEFEAKGPGRVYRSENGCIHTALNMHSE